MIRHSDITSIIGTSRQTLHYLTFELSGVYLCSVLFLHCVNMLVSDTINYQYNLRLNVGKSLLNKQLIYNSAFINNKIYTHNCFIFLFMSFLLCLM